MTSSVKAGAGVVVVGLAVVDDDLGHGNLVCLALPRLDDLLGGLVVDGVEDHLRHREQNTQPVGDLHETD
jgi:hypothetical protein